MVQLCLNESDEYIDEKKNELIHIERRKNVKEDLKKKLH